MVFALLGALLIGITLGLLGSGGSILTVPVLVFLLQRPEKQAIAESLAIVGCIALLGSIPYILRSQVHWRSVLFFGLPGMMGSCLGGNCSFYVSGSFQLILFALAMIFVACLMIFGPTSFDKITPYQQSIWVTILEGFLIGCLTGFIGIGGGFIIVPALAILSNLPMSLAVGTSLVIIAMNSFIGFLGHLVNLSALQLHVDWSIIGIIAMLGVLGSFTGGLVGERMSHFHLRKLFGVSVLMLGLYILVIHIL